MQRQSGTRTHDANVGIDVSKAWLDVCILPDGKTLKVANDKNGYRAVIKTLAQRQIACVVIEATGKFHLKLHQALDRAGCRVAVINPYRSRKFADVHGQLAKTDTIDARMLALFAGQIKPPLTPAPTQSKIELRELVNARTTLVNDQTALKNRLAAGQSKVLITLYNKRLKTVTQDIKRLENAILTRIKANDTFQRTVTILSSIPGIGKISAFTLMALMPELGRCSNKQIAALLGVAPMNWDSGLMRGKRTIRGGRHAARKALYMPALTAATRQPGKPFHETYNGLVARGKPPKVALTAIMRKMIVLANTLVKNDTKWSPEYA